MAHVRNPNKLPAGFGPFTPRAWGQDLNDRMVKTGMGFMKQGLEMMGIKIPCAALFSKIWEFIGPHVKKAAREAVMEKAASLSEEDSGLLDLEVVHVLELALVDGGTALGKLRLTFTGGDIDIHVDNLALLELPFFDLLEGHFLADNALVAVNAVLLDVVGKDTLNHVALVLGNDLVHSLSDFGVG